MKKEWKRLGAALLTAVMAVSFTGCTTGGAEPETPASKGAETEKTAEISAGERVGSGKDTLNIGIAEDKSTLAPVHNSREPGYQIYETLYIVDYVNDEFETILAETLDITDETHMTVTLHEGITDSAGNAFTAKDVLFSLKNASTDTISSMYIPYIDLEQTKVIDDRTIEIALTSSNITQWYLLADVRMVTQAAMEASPDGMITTPVGTGPYVLKEYIIGSSIALTARDDYWGNAPSIKNVNFLVIPETAQRAIALESGSIDYCVDTSAVDFKRFQEMGGYGTYARTQLKNKIVEFNCSQDSICQDVRVRQAIAYGIDASAVNENAFGGLGSVSTGSVSSVCSGYDSSWNPDYYSYDIEKAKALLKEAGVADGTHIVIGSKSSQPDATVAEIVQTFIMDLGFDAEIRSYDTATWTSVRQDSNCGLDLCIQDYSSPEGYFANELWSGIFAVGTNHYENEELYGLLQESITERDEDKRLKMNQKINEIVTEELPGYGMVDLVSLYAWNQSLKGAENIIPKTTHIRASKMSFD